MTEGPDLAAVVRDFLVAQEIEFEQPTPGVFTFALPGERKLSTPVRLEIGAHAVGVQAFVCRQPDENHAAVYRWLLERNRRALGVGFALDRLGDIYLGGRIPLSSVNAGDLDQILGAVLTTADESFNTLLELGFASSIRKEWEWRRLRGESTANLEAFRGWLEAESPEAGSAD